MLSINNDRKKMWKQEQNLVNNIQEFGDNQETERKMFWLIYPRFFITAGDLIELAASDSTGQTEP